MNTKALNTMNIMTSYITVEEALIKCQITTGVKVGVSFDLGFRFASVVSNLFFHQVPITFEPYKND
jgi:hypothetical protein